MDATNKALYDLMAAVKETATDVYWGNSSDFEDEDAAKFTAEDYDLAYKAASLEMIERVRYGRDFPYRNPAQEKDNSIPFDKFICDMGELFGKHLRMRLTEKSLTIF